MKKGQTKLVIYILLAIILFILVIIALYTQVLKDVIPK
jgi:hypothetical protein